MTADGIVLAAEKTGLGTAKAALAAAKAVVAGAGYAAASAAVDTYQEAVDTAKSSADAVLGAANATLEATRLAQDQLVATAQDTLTYTQEGTPERHVMFITLPAVKSPFQIAIDVANQALTAYWSVENGVLQGLQAAVDRLASTAEGVALSIANAALDVARANTKDLELAKAAVNVAGQAGDAVMDAGDWIVSHMVNILNVQKLDVDGDLRNVLQGGELSANVIGKFVEQDVDVRIGFVPGKGELLAQSLFHRLMELVDHGVLKMAR